MTTTLEMGAEAFMSLFSLKCDSCGALIELPGRIGFKVKGGGDAPMLCSSCRRTDWLKHRRDLPGSWSQRTIPLVAAGLGFLLVCGGLWMQRISGPSAQESLPASESLSR